MSTTVAQKGWASLCEDCVWEDGDASHYLGFVNGQAECSRCGEWQASSVFYAKVNDPMRIGGQAAFSTSLALERYPPVIWDTNRYYADLGVDPRATRSQLREAYVRLGGERSARLTFVLSQLLDTNVRARYDATPLGSLFLDYEIETLIREAWVRQHCKDLVQGRAFTSDLPLVDPVETVLDTERARGNHVSPPPSRWGYYRWRSVRPPVAKLAQWRGLLARALAERGEHRNIAVGLSHGMGPWQVIKVGYLTVVFLADDEQPTEALASAAASRVVNTEPGMEIEL